MVLAGDSTGTGGRLKRVARYVKDEEAFCMTYGDGVSDVDITALVNFHRSHGKSATLTSVQPVARFGGLGLTGTLIHSFHEKPAEEGGRVNGGFFVLSPKVLDDITDDRQMFEREPIEALVARQEVHAFSHHGFWQPMDTLRDKQYLEELWNSGNAPWRVW
ncbi:sugar phosphate nucleotidyltransferase [Terriglobus sp. YAF25]|uniref:sugar phosphate nucleotidyltransferase n=1 Tax=Terriglobus sp. YAF25 TaxID=3233080 RepID=UPI003F9C910C